jgi:heme-degrading monooxygenase HmoA
MTFQPDKVNDFETVFNEMQNNIRSFEGCRELKLMKSTAHDNVYFTISSWDSEAHLNRYRESEFFSAVWSRAKALFADKPEAYSLEDIR